MDRYQETFKTWNKLAFKYEEQFMEFKLYNDTYDLFCDSLERKGAAILDVGCGPGNIGQYLFKKNAALKITGIDVAPKMIERAEKNLPNATFHVMDCRNLHLLKKKYDGIICGFAIPYLSPIDCRKFISDCVKLLNPNGIFYLSFVPGDFKGPKLLTGKGGESMYFHYHTLKNIQKELARLGVKNLKTFNKEYKKADKNDEIHTIMINKKIDVNVLPNSV